MSERTLQKKNQQILEFLPCLFIFCCLFLQLVSESHLDILQTDALKSNCNSGDSGLFGPSAGLNRTTRPPAAPEGTFHTCVSSDKKCQTSDCCHFFQVMNTNAAPSAVWSFSL